mmetsp:Transcript_33870/g.72179  ORF Transcript_33870/g.72179 Transcript_33870/m.72179 type:complete len:223 (-) Transcript_33870:1886-2554(-)
MAQLLEEVVDGVRVHNLLAGLVVDALLAPILTVLHILRSFRCQFDPIRFSFVNGLLLVELVQFLVHFVVDPLLQSRLLLGQAVLDLFDLQLVHGPADGSSERLDSGFLLLGCYLSLGLLEGMHGLRGGFLGVEEVVHAPSLRPRHAETFVCASFASVEGVDCLQNSCVSFLVEHLSKAFVRVCLGAQHLEPLRAPGAFGGQRDACSNRAVGDDVELAGGDVC